ncbi:MAG: metalloregulator ArsR/SmtB family transcription factor [Propionibacteriales bacterium]|nr:metalloregulator ArsR/SmtB family transcription factor [Propionibacteriales bacterium]
METTVAPVCCPPLSGPVLGEDEAAQLAGQFKALADPVRVQIMSSLLRAGDDGICACDFVPLVGKSQPTVSHHLKVLREAGAVRSERRGAWIWYRADLDRIDALRASLAFAPAEV